MVLTEVAKSNKGFVTGAAGELQRSGTVLIIVAVVGILFSAIYHNLGANSPQIITTTTKQSPPNDHSFKQKHETVKLIT